MRLRTQRFLGNVVLAAWRAAGKCSSRLRGPGWRWEGAEAGVRRAGLKGAGPRGPQSRPRCLRRGRSRLEGLFATAAAAASSANQSAGGSHGLLPAGR
jgi:hypothetical protein